MRERGLKGEKEREGKRRGMQHNSSHLKPFLNSVLKELPSEPFGVTIMQFTSEEAVIVMKREPRLLAVVILHFGIL